MWLAERLERVNFARLNYILIPDTPEDLERVRQSRAARYFGGPILWLYRALTREGRVVAALIIAAPPDAWTFIIHAPR